MELTIDVLLFVIFRIEYPVKCTCHKIRIVSFVGSKVFILRVRDSTPPTTHFYLHMATKCSFWKICIQFPLSYAIQKFHPQKRNRSKFSGEEKNILKELLHFHADDFRNKKTGYFQAQKLSGYLERVIKKTHPDYLHWNLVKSWDRFHHKMTYEEDLEHISRITKVHIQDLTYTTWLGVKKVQEWIHPHVAVAFTTWLYPLFGSMLAEALEISYDESYEESYSDAIHNFLEEIKETNRQMDILLHR